MDIHFEFLIGRVISFKEREENSSIFMAQRVAEKGVHYTSKQAEGHPISGSTLQELAQNLAKEIAEKAQGSEWTISFDDIEPDARGEVVQITREQHRELGILLQRCVEESSIAS